MPIRTYFQACIWTSSTDVKFALTSRVVSLPYVRLSVLKGRRASLLVLINMSPVVDMR